MPSVTLTDRFVATLAADDREEWLDTVVPGLILRAGPSGKTWSVRYRLATGRRRRFKIGTYPALSLKAARAEARALRGQVELGADPQGTREEARRADRFRDLAAAFIDERAKVEKRTWREDVRKLERDVLPALGDLPARDVTRNHVKALLRKINERGSPVSAHRTGALVSAIFNHGIAEGLVEHNPAVRMPRFSAEESRARVLSVDEIRALWRHCDQEGPITGGAIRWLLLTAARRNEALRATWAEIVGDWWELPAARTKNGRPHRLPLSPPALAVLEALPRIEARPWLFPSGRGEGPLVDLRPALRRLWAREGMEPFVVHDLRRTCLTGLAELRVSRDIRMAVANHVGRADVVATYDRFDRAAEKRQALDAWGRRLVEIAEGRTNGPLLLAFA